MESDISVIIPCYNYAHLLPECIASVRAQTYKPLEIIVVNDGSPDNTKEVCKKLKVRCVTKPNGGLSSARNYGIRRAKGVYIMCLDADDKLPPRSLEEHHRLAGDKVVSQCALQEFGASGQTFFPRGATLHSLWHANSVYCNALFPRAIWEEVGGFDESETMRLGYEDWEFWIRCAKAGCRFATSREIGLLYRIHPESMTRTTTHKNSGLLTQYVQTKHRDIRS